MTTTVKELIERRRTRKGQQGVEHVREFDVVGAADDDAAIAAIEADAEAPGTLTVVGNSLYRAEVEITEQAVGGNYVGTVTWQPIDREKDDKQDPPTGSEDSASFDVSSQGRTIVTALGGAAGQTVTLAAGVPAGALVADGLINVQPDGTAEGIPDNPPGTKLVITYYKDAASVTPAYITALENLRGTLNNAVFKGYALGILYLESIRGQKRNNDVGDFALTFTFVVGRPYNGPVAGVAGISAGAHTFIEERTGQKIDGTGKVVGYIKGIVVSSLYDFADWSALGIGV